MFLILNQKIGLGYFSSIKFLRLIFASDKFPPNPQEKNWIELFLIRSKNFKIGSSKFRAFFREWDRARSDLTYSINCFELGFIWFYFSIFPIFIYKLYTVPPHNSDTISLLASFFLFTKISYTTEAVF